MRNCLHTAMIVLPLLFNSTRAASQPARWPVCAGRDFGAAINACTEIIRQTARRLKLARAHNRRGTAYFRQGAYSLALAGFNNLAWAWYKVNMPERGLSHADRAVKMPPGNASVWDTRAHIYEKLGRRGDAVCEYLKALELDPSHKSAGAGLQRLGVGE